MADIWASGRHQQLRHHLPPGGLYPAERFVWLNQFSALFSQALESILTGILENFVPT
jgi:hypothetical protein